MNPSDIASLDWNKGGGFLPAVVQDKSTGAVLMVGVMNPTALRLTLLNGRVTLFSRTRERLWVKGESSGNFIEVENVNTDCDRDALLIIGRPRGPVCHTGARDCFLGHPPTDAAQLGFLQHLERVIAERMANPRESSYTATLHALGPTRMAQKVGEEALEVAIAALGEGNGALLRESADLLYHLLLLLKSRGLTLLEIVRELEARHASKALASAI